MKQGTGEAFKLVCQPSNGHYLGTRLQSYLKKHQEVFVLNLGFLLNDADEKIRQAGFDHRLEFSAGGMEKITGISRPRLAGWQKQGMCLPSMEKAVGTGTANIYTRTDIYAILLAARLIENGWGKRGGYDFMKKITAPFFDCPRDDRYLIFYLDGV